MSPEQFAEVNGILQRHTAAMEQIAEGVRILLQAVISADGDESGDGQNGDNPLRTMDDPPQP